MQREISRTHEEYLHETRDAVIRRAVELGTVDADEAQKLEHAKLVYGVGNGSYRGVCHFEAWENGIGKVDVVEIAATAEENWIQLAGTTIHELGHVLAGMGAGHGKGWKESCERLGLRRAAAAGQIYRLAQIDRIVRERVWTIAKSMDDGLPAFRTYGFGFRLVTTIRPCSQGIGTRGGKSRGKGSGSRQRLFECQGCEKPQKIRAATDDVASTHKICGTDYVLVEKKAEGGEAA